MKKSNLAESRPREKGLAGLEFAISLPLVLTLTLGVAEFGVGFYQNQLLTEAARSAARYASRIGSPRSEQGLRNLTEKFLQTAGLDPAKATISVVGMTGQPGEPLKVLVSYPAGFTFLSGFFTNVLDDETALLVTGQAAMELE